MQRLQMHWLFQIDLARGTCQVIRPVAEVLPVGGGDHAVPLPLPLPLPLSELALRP